MRRSGWRGRKEAVRAGWAAVGRHVGAWTFCLLVVGFTAAYFTAMRQDSVELSFDELSLFERQVHAVGNRSVYVTGAGSADALLETVRVGAWARVSGRVDYVALVYGGAGGGRGWAEGVAAAAAGLEAGRGRGYGVGLFPCGCVLPNAVLRGTRTRFEGYECAMLPGFVMGKECVRFVGQGGGRCKDRERVLAGPWFARLAWKLGDAREEHRALRERLERG